MAINDDKEILKNIVGQIRDLYVDIIKLRNEDRNKYKEMCARLDAIEKDRTLRTQRKARKNMKQKNRKGSQSKNTPGAQRQMSSNKEDSKESKEKKSPGGGDTKSLKNDDDADKQE